MALFSVNWISGMDEQGPLSAEGDILRTDDYHEAVRCADAWDQALRWKHRADPLGEGAVVVLDGDCQCVYVPRESGHRVA